jgi:hypothetical protein
VFADGGINLHVGDCTTVKGESQPIFC